MSFRWGVRHGIHGLVSGLITIALVIKGKGTVFIDVLVPGPVDLAIDFVLYHVPVAVYEPVGTIVQSVVGASIPALAVGLIIGKPLVHALVPVLKRESFRSVVSHWLIHTIVIVAAVFASLEGTSDPGGIASGIVHHYETHTIPATITQLLLSIGDLVSSVTVALFGVGVDNTIGILIGVTGFAFYLGMTWDRHIGHE